jgi:integration host factor subunit beta
MLKPDLAKIIHRQNPHLYQRDAEKIVDAILAEIVAAMARGDSRRAAGVR